MKPIQIVIDRGLLARIDREAHRQRVSRSAFVRDAVSRVLEAADLQAKIEAFEREYQRRPLTTEERRLSKALSRHAARMTDEPGQKETW